MRFHLPFATSMVLGALVVFGCADSPPGPELSPGPGRFALSHRPVYLWLDESGDEPTIHVFPEPAVTHWTQDPGRIVWVVNEKREGDEWVIEWKGPDTGSGLNYWPGKKRIPRGTREAFYTTPPAGDPPSDSEREETAARQGGIGRAGGAIWAYEVHVEREMPDGTVQEIARLDPHIIIKDPPDP